MLPAPGVLSPVEAGLFLDSQLIVAEQAADDVPAVGAANLDVPLLVDADHGIREDPRARQVLHVQLILLDELPQQLAGHLDESHGLVFLEQWTNLPAILLQAAPLSGEERPARGS